MKIINTTPHPINMQSASGETYTVEPCGVLVNARPVEKSAGTRIACGAYSPAECPEEHGVCDGCSFAAELVRTRFEPDSASEATLAKLEQENPGAIIVGSIIAAQAFPGRVFAMVPAPGFERVPPAEKRMRDDKFTAF